MNGSKALILECILKHSFFYFLKTLINIRSGSAQIWIEFRLLAILTISFDLWLHYFGSLLLRSRPSKTVVALKLSKPKEVRDSPLLAIHYFKHRNIFLHSSISHQHTQWIPIYSYFPKYSIFNNLSFICLAVPCCAVPWSFNFAIKKFI